LATESISIGPFQPGDLDGVVSLLNREMTADPTTSANFQRRVLLDLNFDPKGAPVAKDGDQIVGFMCGMVRKYLMEDQAPDTDRGYVTLLAVDREYRRRGIGTRLWEQVKAYFQSRDVKAAIVGTFAPNYFVPGVDQVAYSDAIEFLKRQGFTVPVTVLSMDSCLVDLKTPDWIVAKEAQLAAEGLSFEVFSPEHTLPLLDHLRECFPGDWQRYIRESMVRKTMGHFERSEIYVAMHGGKCLGFCQHENERFGPFGVDDKERGRGIGAVLLLKCLHGMKALSIHNAWFMSTTDDAAKVYVQGGFKETRRHAVMKCTL
jgi:ribosomal protein S18 acetylase RimI-like enzyme